MTRILRGLSSRRPACGCLIGVYETYDGRVIAIVDVRGDACRDAEHERGRPIIVQETAQAPAGS